MRDHRNQLLDTNNNNDVWVIFLLFVFKITDSKKNQSRYILVNSGFLIQLNFRSIHIHIF